MERKKRMHVMPKAGSSFVRKWGEKEYRMTVIEDGGSVKYKVGKEVFSSPSSAAKHITQYDVNGWTFWKID